MTKLRFAQIKRYISRRGNVNCVGTNPHISNWLIYLKSAKNLQYDSFKKETHSFQTKNAVRGIELVNCGLPRFERDVKHHQKLVEYATHVVGLYGNLKNALNFLILTILTSFFQRNVRFPMQIDTLISKFNFAELYIKKYYHITQRHKFANLE